MQTFLPYRSYEETARALDFKRLNKQVIEGMQLCNVFLRRMGVLEDGKRGWANHPVTKLWTLPTGDILLPELAQYIDRCEAERWTRPQCRKATVWIERRDAVIKHCTRPPRTVIWSDELHLSHRRNLVRKDEGFYIPKFGKLDPAFEYNWQHPIELI